MNIIYIFGIAILLAAGTDSLNEDAKTDKNLQQRILLRKLLNIQETKPATWNEVLADVLVNKIRIFSFTGQDKENTTKDASVQEKSFFTDFFSKVFVVYKKFIYDAFVGKRKTSDDELFHATSLPTTVAEIPLMDPEEVIRATQVTYIKGPKSEVELVEPKYHGKITADETTEHSGVDTTDNKPSVTGRETSKPEEGKHIDPEINSTGNSARPANVDPGLRDSVTCPEGYMKSESGDCVKNISKLMISVPNQCPIGYREDWWGNCRKIFRF